MTQKIITFVSILIAVVSLSLWAAKKHGSHTPNMSHHIVPNNSATPHEGGQATFSALIEIVAMLEGDPKTDWEKVDIDGLRIHLRDMNHLMLLTEVNTSILGATQIQFDIRGTTESTPAIHRMAPAHSRFIEQSRGWQIETTLNEYGATLKITVDTEDTLKQLSALGFYGFMSLDSHHQAHHYQMAIGNSH